MLPLVPPADFTFGLAKAIGRRSPDFSVIMRVGLTRLLNSMTAFS